MPLTRFVAVIVGVALAVGAFSATYWTLREHAANSHIHLPDDFDRRHGAAVGDRDLEASKQETTKMVDQVIKVRIDDLAATLMRSRR